jgi:hypothetical protein
MVSAPDWIGAKPRNPPRYADTGVGRLLFAIIVPSISRMLAKSHNESNSENAFAKWPKSTTFPTL